MVCSCCVYGCGNRLKRGCRVGFFRFPRDGARRKRWILATKKRYWRPTDETRICSEHFQTGKPSSDPNHPDYVPSIFTIKSQKAINLKDEKKKTTSQTQAEKKSTQESKGMKHTKLGRLLPAAASQRLPFLRPLGEEKIKKKENENKKKLKKSVTKSRAVAKTGTTHAFTDVQKSTPINSSKADSEKALHSASSNENSSLNISHSSDDLLEKDIKFEVSWWKEYGYVENVTSDRCDGNDQVISIKDFFQENDSSSENDESGKVMDMNEEKIKNNVCSERNMERKNEELPKIKNYFNVKKLGKCKIGRREETFGRFIACEMSDLSENPILYLKTKQVILRALIDAHTELTNSYL